MTSIIQPPRAYPRLHHHPLASAFLAILWATLLVVGVKGWCALQGDRVLAGEGEPSEQVERPSAPTNATY